MIYTIDWIEQSQTKSGKTRATCDLVAVSGQRHEKVTIWGDFPNFDALVNGGEVDGNIVAAKDPKYGPTLYPPSRVIYKPQKPAFNPKSEEIRLAQERKEDSILLAGSMRDATLLTIAEFAGNTYTHEAYQKKWLEWRDWLTKQHRFPEQL